MANKRSFLPFISIILVIFREHCCLICLYLVTCIIIFVLLYEDYKLTAFFLGRQLSRKRHKCINEEERRKVLKIIRGALFRFLLFVVCFFFVLFLCQTTKKAGALQKSPSKGIAGGTAPAGPSYAAEATQQVLENGRGWPSGGGRLPLFCGSHCPQLRGPPGMENHHQSCRLHISSQM